MDNIIGYNPNEVNALMDEVAKTYNKLGEYMSEGWPQVSTTMQTNWKGVDEQDYEAKLANRMNKLYTNTTNLIQATLETISSLGESWRDFQNNNRMQGGEGDSQVANATFEFVIPAIQTYDMASIVKLNENSFQGENLGLQSGGGSTIKSAIDGYTSAIKANVTAIYTSIDSNKAFIGGQGQKINEFVVAVGDAVKQLSTDIADIYQALDTLTDAGYSQADTDASSSIDSAKNQVEQAVSEIR